MIEIPEYIPKGTREEIEEQLKSWVGKKVKRGPTWDWGNQDIDGNRNKVEGTITEIPEHGFTTKNCGCVKVVWDNCHSNTYRIGNGFADVILVEEISIKNSNDPICCGQKMDWINMAYKCSKCWRVK